MQYAHVQQVVVLHRCGVGPRHRLVSSHTPRAPARVSHQAPQFPRARATYLAPVYKAFGPSGFVAPEITNWSYERNISLHLDTQIRAKLEQVRPTGVHTIV